jgi:hypothetical protein
MRTDITLTVRSLRLRDERALPQSPCTDWSRVSSRQEGDIFLSSREMRPSLIAYPRSPYPRSPYPNRAEHQTSTYLALPEFLFRAGASISNSNRQSLPSQQNQNRSKIMSILHDNGLWQDRSGTVTICKNPIHWDLRYTTCRKDISAHRHIHQ